MGRPSINISDTGNMPSAAPLSSSRRLLVVGPSMREMARQHGRFIKSCVQRGVSVMVLSPETSASGSEGLLRLGAQAQSISNGPDGFTFFRARKAARAFADQIRSFHPSAVLTFGPGIIPAAVSAARRAGVARIGALLDELPEGGLSKRLTRAARSSSVVIVHNAEDARTVAEAVGQATHVVRVPGTGSDLTLPLGEAMPVAQDPVIFLAAARLDRSRGIYDYLEAARIARENGLAARFMLAGSDGVEAGAIKPETLSRYGAHVDYIGDAAELGECIRQCHVFVSPSHREGMPAAVLSALAAGRAIVATDIPGSHDTVDEMVNGTLCAPEDPASLADAFTRVVRNRKLLQTMGRASRSKAERTFSDAAVHEALQAALQI